MRRSRDALLDALVVFRSLDPGVTLHQLIAFLYTCENEGLSVQELADLAGLTQSTASRNLRCLGPPDGDWSCPPALGLVQGMLNPRDGRSHVVHLTMSGQQLRQKFDAIIARAVPIALETS